MADYPLSFRWPKDFVQRVDEARGDISRSLWVRRAVERALGEASGTDKADVSRRGRDHGADPSPAPAEQPKEKPGDLWFARPREFRPYPKDADRKKKR